MEQEKTLFEKIVAGEIPCAKIYEDEDTFAFLDIAPFYKGHTLVIPKKPYKNIYELPDETAGKLMSSVKKIAGAVKKGVGADGINILMNNEAAAGQEVFHAHIHIIPRKNGDVGLLNHETYDEGEMEEFAEKIAEEI